MKGYQGRGQTQPQAHPQSHTFVGAINFDSLMSGQVQQGSTGSRSPLPGSPFSALSSPAASAPPQVASSPSGSQPAPLPAGAGLHMTRKASGSGSGELPPLGPHISRRRASTRSGELPHAIRPASPLSRKGSATTSQELPAAALGLPANPARMQASPQAQRDAPQTVWGQVDRQRQRGWSGGTVMCVGVEVCLPGCLLIRAATAVFVRKPRWACCWVGRAPGPAFDEQALLGLQMACDAPGHAWLHATTRDHIIMAAVWTADEPGRPRALPAAAAAATAPGEPEIVNPFALAAGTEPQAQWPARTATAAEAPAGGTGHQVA